MRELILNITNRFYGCYFLPQFPQQFFSDEIHICENSLLLKYIDIQSSCIDARMGQCNVTNMKGSNVPNVTLVNGPNVPHVTHMNGPNVPNLVSL